jgi:hypothetical protein
LSNHVCIAWNCAAVGRGMLRVRDDVLLAIRDQVAVSTLAPREAETGLVVLLRW